jgi:hypothetical protein
MKLFKSIRPYPITLYKGNQQVIVHPGQTIELPEQFGLMYSGLLMPIYDHITPTIVTPIVEEKIEVVKDVFVSKDEPIVETTSEIVEAVVEEVEETVEVVEEVKRSRGRPKKV